MDWQTTEDYLRAHWPAALLMAVVVIPATVTVVLFFHPPRSDGSDAPTRDATQAKLIDLDTRLGDLFKRIDVLDRLYRFQRDDENRWSPEDLARLYTRSQASAVVSAAVGESKGKP